MVLKNNSGLFESGRFGQVLLYNKSVKELQRLSLAGK